MLLDVTDLEVGTTLTVGDIELPAGVESLVPESALVVSGIITRMAAEEAADAEDEDEEADADGDEAAEGDADETD